VKLRLTKGVHLVIERSKLPVPDAVVMADGSRILFAIPWGERLILGTTDTDYDGPTENPQCDADDVAYVLKVTNRTFPGAKVTEQDIISAWAGLRPLIADPNGKPSDISRAHEIHTQPDGWIDVAGGKLTTYRLMAEQTIDAAEKLLGRDKTPSRTAEQPLLAQATYSGVVPTAVSREAVEHFCRNEWVRHLDDLMIRRTSWRYYHRDHLSIAEQAASWANEVLGWGGERTASELERYRRMTEPLAPAWEPVAQPVGATA
jgi:glycerol-3-phosphate dehydrogenase